MRLALVFCCFFVANRAEAAAGPVLAAVTFSDKDVVQTKVGDLVVRLSAGDAHENSGGADSIAEITSPGGSIRIVLKGDKSPDSTARVVRLTPAAEPQVLFQRAATGSAACVASKLAVYEGTWRVIDLDRICESDGGYQVLDLAGDGYGELVSTTGYFDVFENHPHAAYEPIRIQRLVADRLVVATAARRFRDYLRKSLPGTPSTPPDPERSEDPSEPSDYTGPADWMATKVLLGETREAWAQMVRTFGAERQTFDVYAEREIHDECPAGRRLNLPFLKALATVLVANNYVRSGADVPVP